MELITITLSIAQNNITRLNEKTESKASEEKIEAKKSSHVQNVVKKRKCDIVEI